MDNIDDFFNSDLATHTVTGVRVIVDFPDSDFSLGGESMTTEDAQMTFATHRFADLRTGTIVTLKSLRTGAMVDYKVRQIRKVDDGEASRAGLLKVGA